MRGRKAAVRFPFPDRPRLWGTAVSHYQVEGGDECDWSAWERAGRTRGEPCSRAVGSWERYEDDAGLALNAGANAFRFSISWSRVEPSPGVWNDQAVERYRHFVDHLRRIGLEPVVTLFHYAHPAWFHRRTPWTSPDSVEQFARFARKIASSFGSAVRFYIPLNEPLVFLLAGFFDGQIPPGIADGGVLANVFDHLMAAHCAATAAIREANPAAAIGVAHNMMAFAPERDASFLDRAMVRIAHHCYNQGVLEAFSTGRWDFLLPPTTRVRGRRDDLARSVDLFGVNYYSRLHLRCPGRERLIGDFRYLDSSGIGLTDNGWEIVPDAFEQLLLEAAVSRLPLVVTENGLADRRDVQRPHFIEHHAAAIARVEAQGVPIHGYFHWSLLDNYEWLDGFGPRFGLYSVDRRTMKRKARASVEVFRREGARFLSRTVVSSHRGLIS